MSSLHYAMNLTTVKKRKYEKSSCLIFRSLLKIVACAERCPSGRRSTIGNRVYLDGYREFKSLPLRQNLVWCTPEKTGSS